MILNVAEKRLVAFFMRLFACAPIVGLFFRQSPEKFFANHRKNFSPIVGKILFHLFRWGIRKAVSASRWCLRCPHRLPQKLNLSWILSPAAVTLPPRIPAKIYFIARRFDENLLFADSLASGAQNVYNNCSASCAIHIINLRRN